MAGCCDPRGCDRMFGPGCARHVAQRFRRRGLDAAARGMVDFLAAGDVTGATVLDIGGGVGEIGIELLRRGAARATTLELSPAYADEARRLAADAGVAGRAHRMITDIAASPQEVEPADLVVLHRVVCCYPDYARLLTAAADHTRSRLAFSHPPRNILTRGFFATQNLVLGALGRQYRAFAHPPGAMVNAASAGGMQPLLARTGVAWHVQGLAR